MTEISPISHGQLTEYFLGPNDLSHQLHRDCDRPTSRYGSPRDTIKLQPRAIRSNWQKRTDEPGSSRTIISSDDQEHIPDDTWSYVVRAGGEGMVSYQSERPSR
jgi:hypothetical protein